MRSPAADVAKQPRGLTNDKISYCLKTSLSVSKLTRSSAIAEGPRDALCQLKSCQLPRNSVETTCTTSPEHIEVMKLEGYSGAMCNNHVHSNMTRSSRFHYPIDVINKQTTDELWISPVYRRLAVAWRNILSPQCRNCSRDPGHAHLGNTHSSQVKTSRGRPVYKI